MIPLCEPHLSGKELEYVTDCIATGWISSNGDYVRRFEKALAEYLGAGFAVACNCGTSALHISLILAGVGANDEVMVPTVTFIAPINAVRYAGAFPVFIDCDQYCNIDVAGALSFLETECILRGGTAVNKKTGRRVAAIVPVHVFGTAADMDSIMEMAHKYHLAVIEDASESLGSLYKGRKCGALGPIAGLSFNGNKIVTSGGGGAIVTNDENVARRARYLTTQAKEDGIEYIHHSVGYNYRMNNVLAAVGLAQLETIDEKLAVKRRNFDLYANALGEHGGRQLLQQPSWSDSNRWFYAFLCSDRGAKERILQACLNKQIQVRPLWFPNHLQQPYVAMESYRIQNAVSFYDRVVNLPCSVTLTEEQIGCVVGVIQQTGILPETPVL